jgi:hypothetical protein
MLKSAWNRGREGDVGGFLNIGNSATKTDRSNELTGFGDLSSVFNFGMPTATSALGGANNYYQKLLTGNRATMEQAEAPEINAVQAGSDAQKRQLAASGTARGGGVAAANQTRGTTTEAAIDNALMQARPAAASAETGIGENALGTSLGAGTNLTSIASNSRALSNALNPGQQYLADITNLIGAMGGGKGISAAAEA